MAVNPLQGLGTEAAQSVSSIFARARSFGAGVKDIAAQVAGALQVAAQRAITVARNGIYSAYRAGVSLFLGDALGWIWKADLSGDPPPCAACIAMDGTKHTPDETLDSHINCRCQPEPYYTEDEADNAPTGADWFDQQSEDTQSAILGPGMYQLYADNKITLQDVVQYKDDATYGRSIAVRPLKDLTNV
jgi:hypothetical protein